MRVSLSSPSPCPPRSRSRVKKKLASKLMRVFTFARIFVRCLCLLLNFVGLCASHAGLLVHSAHACIFFSAVICFRNAWMSERRTAPAREVGPFQRLEKEKGQTFGAVENHSSCCSANQFFGSQGPRTFFLYPVCLEDARMFGKRLSRKRTREVVNDSTYQGQEHQRHRRCWADRFRRGRRSTD